MPQEQSTRLRLQVIADRLQLSLEETQALLQAIHADAVSILGTGPAGVHLSTEIHGRDLDLVLTLHRQNLPRHRSPG
jgi:hypothetical protein